MTTPVIKRTLTFFISIHGNPIHSWVPKRTVVSHFVCQYIVNEYPRQNRSSTPKVATFNSCTKCVGSQGIINNRPPDCHPVFWAWMHGWAHNRTYFDLQATVRGSLVCLAYSFLTIDMGVCTTRHCQTSGRLMQELNVVTVYICTKPASYDVINWNRITHITVKDFLQIRCYRSIHTMESYHACRSEFRFHNVTLPSHLMRSTTYTLILWSNSIQTPLNFSCYELEHLNCIKCEKCEFVLYCMSIDCTRKTCRIIQITKHIFQKVN